MKTSHAKIQPAGEFQPEAIADRQPRAKGRGEQRHLNKDQERGMTPEQKKALEEYTSSRKKA